MILTKEKLHLESFDLKLPSLVGTVASQQGEERLWVE